HLDPETSYQYRVRARNYAGASSFSLEVQAETPPSPGGPDPYELDMESLRLWLSADYGLTPDAINIWRDRSGSNNNARQTYYQRQPLLAEVALGGRPVLRFEPDDSKPDSLALSARLFWHDGAPMTEGEIIIALRSNSSYTTHTTHRI